MSVYTWGLGKSGQLGTGTDATRHTPQLLKSKDVIGPGSISQISSGGLFTCSLTHDGQIASFGCGKHGRLGNGSDDDKLTPTRVRFPINTKIVQVSCGSWHGAAISDKGELFTWGYPKACGHSDAPPDPRGVLAPTPVPSFTPSRLTGVSCGHNFTLVWSEDGKAFSWGSGRHGVLGQGSEDDIPTPKQIESLSDVVYMNAGYAHCGAVTGDGKVYMFGKGSDGALGLGEKVLKNGLVPSKVETLSGLGVVELSCSVGEHHGHTLAVTREGVVYSWGDGYKGKLGLGNQETRYMPTKISPQSFQDEPITHVASGGIHSAAVSRTGHVFTWGCGSDGRLGHPEGKGHRYLFRSDVPKQVEFFKPSDVVQNICCSYYHTVVQVTDKNSETWPQCDLSLS